MSMLPPLVESSSSERARLLLRAARTDGPRPGAAGRTLSALGVVGSTAKVALAAGAAAPTAGVGAGAGSSSLALIAAKWVLVGTLSGGALASGAAFVFSEEPIAAAPAAATAPPLVSVTPTPVTVAVPTADTTATPAPAGSAPKPSSASTPSNGKASSEPGTAPVAAPSQAAFESPEQSKLLHDVALLDDARRALRAGNAAQAKAALERYEHERLTHVLDREALVMRDRLRGLLEDAK